MRSIVLSVVFLCALFSSAEARRGHGRLPWCGIYMNQYFGKNDRSLWVARNWAREGSNAGGPSVGAVVVWPHHVGVIVGQTPRGGWIVHSGNDGGAVRTRERSLAGVIAYRTIGAGGSAYVDLKGQEQAAGRRNKHLVALAVEGGPSRISRRAALKEAGTVADVAGKTFASFGDAAAFTPPADRAYETLRKKRKAVMERERMFVPLFAPVPEPVSPALSKIASGSINHSSPHTQRDQVRADRPSSRASLRSEARMHRASLSSGNAGYARGGGAGAGWREYRPDLI